MTEEDTICPACGDEFSSQQYMRLHYTNKEDRNHEGNISHETINCNNCDEEVTDLKEKERKFCSQCIKTNEQLKTPEARENIRKGQLGRKLTEETKRKIGDGNRGDTHTEETIRKMSESSKGIEHSEETKQDISESLMGHEGYWEGKTGEGTPLCGMTGDDHPTSTDGTSTYKYSSAFYRNREKAIQRDDEQCRICGKSREEQREKHSYDLTAHHIEPRGNFIDEPGEKPPDEAAEMSNLFTVCSSCHSPVDAGKIEIPDNGNKFVD